MIRIVILALLLGGCQTIIPPRGSEVIEEGGVTEILPPPALPEKTPPLCLVRARLFRGLIGVPCAELAQEIRP